MKKMIILLTILIVNLFALEVSTKKIENAKTLLILLEEKGIKEPKLTFDKHNINFYPHPNKTNTFYALVPIHYHKKQKKYKIIVSYIKNKKKTFKGIPITVIDGKYKSEVIKVSKNKVSLSEKNKKRVSKEYNEAIKIYNKASNKLYTNGKPYNKPLNSKITSSFGKKRVYNGILKSYHSGTDYKAMKGTKIKAVNDGKIVIASNRFYAGNSLVIDHGEGIFSCYFHLSKINHKVGNYVKKDEIIALSGSTGRVTGPHLHFAFRVHGIIVDPIHLTNLLNNNSIY